jgi:glycosyl transferase family 87
VQNDERAPNRPKIRPAPNLPRALVIIALATAALLGMIVVHDRLKPSVAILNVHGDFSAFYCAGAVVRDGGNPYRTEPLRSCERRLGETPAEIPWYAFPVPFPGYVLALFSILARLPFAAAHALWIGLILFSVGLTAWALARLTGFSFGMLALLVWTPLGLYTLNLGEPTALITALLALAALAAEHGSRRSAWIAGVLVGLAMIEPHVALPAFVALLIFAPRSRAALLVTALALALISVAALGVAQNVEYFTQALPLQAAAELHQSSQFSLTHALVLLAVPDHLALTLGSLSYIVALAAGVWAGRRLDRATNRPACIILIPAAVGLIGGVFSHNLQVVTAIGATVLLASLPRVPRALAVVPLLLFSVDWLADTTWKFALLCMSLSMFAGILLATQTFGLPSVRRWVLAGALAAVLTSAYLALYRLPHPPCCISSRAPAPRVGSDEDVAKIQAYVNTLSPFSLPDYRMEMQKIPFVLGLIAILACAVATTTQGRGLGATSATSKY